MLALIAGSMAATRPAWAQAEKPEEKAPAAAEDKADAPAEDEAEADVAEPEEPAEPPAKAEASVDVEKRVTLTPPAEKERPEVATEATAEPAVTGPDDDMSEQKNGFRREKPFPTTLEWSGGLEIDVGHARYTFDNEALHTESYNDFRGRFVFGPTVNYRFGSNNFIAARGEAVLWVRETSRQYQINVDDVYAQIGQRGLWDVKLGRFRTWRVYHKGLGFDLYTLEDSGACTANPCDPDTAVYGPRTYEVSYIYDRETAGHVAAHLYPTPWAGIEVAGVYGAQGVRNSIGARGAAIVHFPFVRVSAAGEYRRFDRAEELTTTDPVTGDIFTCPRCDHSAWYGFGGGAELTIKPIEIGLNGARGYQSNYTRQGLADNESSHQVTSMGGYAEVDVGSFTIQRGLILGFGLNRTEVLFDDDDFDQHTQGAAYIAFPLGFNAASIKLVVSRATLSNESDTTGDGVYEVDSKAMTAGRVRLTYPF